MIADLIESLIVKILFLAEVALGNILDLLYEVFEIYSGIKPVVYSGKQSFLLNVFFSNDVVSAIYKGMALIGIAMTFGFAVAAVIKKGFDSTGEKVKATYGMIIGNVLKAILLILLMTAIVSATISATGVLMQQINYLFNNAEEIAYPSSITFDNNDFATMFRVIDTVSNCSLNSSFNNRFNINGCFNTIRMDLQILENSGTFNFTYDNSPEAKNSWQAALLAIYNSADIYSEQPADQYNEQLTDAIMALVDKVQKDASFKPLASYSVGKKETSDDSILGRTVMLSASMEAANNSRYNKKPSINDSLRRPYYVGKRNIYSYSQVSDDFDLGFGSWNHLVAIFVMIILIKEFLKILMNCIARIFNIIVLYITAPGFASVMPLDDGGKMKQWTTAFVIQSLSIFGTVISVRLLMVFIPIVLDAELEVFADPIKNILAKILLIVGISLTAEKASDMIGGILADNAGYQSIMAGNVGSGFAASAMALGAKTLRGATSATGSILKGASDAAGLTTVGRKIGSSVSNKVNALRDKGGVGSWIKHAAQGKDFNSKATDKANAEAQDKKDQKKWQSDVRTSLRKISGEDKQDPDQKKYAKDDIDLAVGKGKNTVPRQNHDDSEFETSKRPTLTPPPSLASIKGNSKGKGKSKDI